VQFGYDFAEEVSRFRHHGNKSLNLLNPSWKRYFAFVCKLSWEFTTFAISLTQKPGQEGLEPPTDGFGDRYSTN
jgi:hypothetical protein